MLPLFDRRQALRLLAAVGVGTAASALSACSNDAETDASPQKNRAALTVGLVFPSSGDNQALGAEVRSGFQMYLENRGNVLGGHPIRVVAVDEGTTIDAAKAAVEQLIRDRVRVLVGITDPVTLSAVKDSIEASQIPLVTPSPSPVALPGASYIWRTGFVTEEPGRALGKWVAENADGPVFVLADDTAGMRDDARGFIRELTSAGGSTVDDPIYCTPGTQEFSECLARLKALTVGAVYCAYVGLAGVEVVRELKASGLPQTLKVIGSGMLTEGAQLTQLGDAALGIYTAMNYSTQLNTATNRRFVSDYQKTYNSSPSTMAVAAYDAAAVLDKALTLAKTVDDALEINRRIGHLGQIESPRGTWEFTQNRTPFQKWFLRQVKADGPVLANVLAAELGTLGFGS